MRLEVVSQTGDLMGSTDVHGTQWTIDGDCFANRTRIEVQVISGGMPRGVCVVRTDGVWAGYTTLKDTPEANVGDLVVFASGDLRYELQRPTPAAGTLAAKAKLEP